MARCRLYLHVEAANPRHQVPKSWQWQQHLSMVQCTGLLHSLHLNGILDGRFAESGPELRALLRDSHMALLVIHMSIVQVNLKNMNSIV